MLGESRISMRGARLAHVPHYALLTQDGRRRLCERVENGAGSATAAPRPGSPARRWASGTPGGTRLRRLVLATGQLVPTEPGRDRGVDRAVLPPADRDHLRIGKSPGIQTGSAVEDEPHVRKVARLQA